MIKVLGSTQPAAADATRAAPELKTPETAAPSAPPPAPQSIFDPATQRPRFGTYAGAIETVDRRDLQGAYKTNLLKETFKVKRWEFTRLEGTAQDGRRISMVSLMHDLGYLSQGFVAVFDMTPGHEKVLANRSFKGLPGFAHVNTHPGEGLDARLDLPGAHLSTKRDLGQGTFQHRVDVSRSLFGSKPSVGMSFDLTPGEAPALSVIAPVTKNQVNVTTKTTLRGSGTITIGNEKLELHDVHGLSDYTVGELKHHTAWRWAESDGKLADGRPFALNLVEGFNEDSPVANENTLWVGNKLLTLPRVKFEFDKDNVLAPWRITQRDPEADFEIDLRFTPIASHSESQPVVLGLVGGVYEQPTGVYNGTIRDRKTGEVYQLKDAGGVSENQDIKF